MLLTSYGATVPFEQLIKVSNLFFKKSHVITNAYFAHNYRRINRLTVAHERALAKNFDLNVLRYVYLY